ncbi:MAG: efflux RND transporter periplasmic adaptor subunit [Saprospiraceae bacterium]|nr:efflux RND transporter periplasmic adaptor subunit [Saprospiraceae bacterium]
MRSKFFSLLVILTLIIQACGSGSSGENNLAAKQSKLTTLLAEKTKLEEEIAKLEAEITVLDTSEKVQVSKLVSVTPVSTGEFSSQVEVMGKIDADANATISASMPGTVTKIYVKAGSNVQTGQTLATVDNGVLQQNIAQTKQQLDFATDIYNKQKSLWDQKIGSEVQFLTAKNNKESLESALNILNEQNDMYKIKSLYPGVVDEVSVKLGQTIAPGMPAFRIVGTQGLKMKAELPESYASKIKTGASVVIYMPDLDKEINGKVNYISKVVDPMNRTFTAEILIGGNRTDIKTNMVGILRIKDYNNATAITIPIKTLQRNTEGYFVYILKEEAGKKIAKQTNITTGVVSGNNVEVLSGLKAGDMLITTGYQSITEGDLLKVAEN